MSKDLNILAVLIHLRCFVNKTTETKKHRNKERNKHTHTHTHTHTDIVHNGKINSPCKNHSYNVCLWAKDIVRPFSECLAQRQESPAETIDLSWLSPVITDTPALRPFCLHRQLLPLRFSCFLCWHR
jgi:hypothetical protein